MLRTSIAFIWLTIILFVAALFIVLRIFVISRFLELEKQNTIKNVNRLVGAISERERVINAKASDWAAWDDAYQFVQDRNSRFIRSNFALSAFTGNNLNLIAYTDNSGRIVYARWYQPGDDKMVPVPGDVRQVILREGLLTNHRSVLGSVSGIIMLEQGPMLIASRPVVTSNETGPIRGSLIFGQLLNSQEMQHLSRIIHVSATVERLDKGDLPADFIQAHTGLTNGEQAAVEPINSQTVAGYTILDDIFGDPALMLRVEMPRTLYNRGLALTYYTLAALVALCILFGSIGSLLFIRTVHKEHEFDARTREFYRSTIEVATGGKLVVCEHGCIPDTGEPLGMWEVEQAKDVAPARNEAAQIARNVGMDEPVLTDFTLCMGEALTNAVKHGGGGVACLYRKNDGLLFVVSDHGPGIEALAIPELALKPRYTTVASMGVGYKVMISLADKVYLATGPKGTTVAIEKALDSTRAKEEAYRIPETWSS